MNEYLMPAAAIAVELLKQWQADNPKNRPSRAELSSLYEEALLGVMDGARRAKQEEAMANRSQP